MPERTSADPRVPVAAAPPAPRPGRAAGAVRWLGTGSMAVADQGLFAGSNFLLNILLARWLTPADYGGFSVAFVVFVFAGTIHSALLTDPMLVFGPRRYQDRQGRYLGALLRGHAAFVVPAGLMMGLAGLGCWRWGPAPLGTALLSLALAQPFLLLPWLLRRACYLRWEPWRAVVAGLGYSSLMVFGLLMLWRSHRLSVPTAVGVMALSSLMAGAWLVRTLRVAWRAGADSEGIRLAEVAKAHWRYGRWILAASLVASIPTSGCYLILPLFAGIEESGALRALMNLVMPVLHANAALGALLLPRLVQTRGTPAYGRIVRVALSILAGGACLGWLLLGIGHRSIIRAVYGGRYETHSDWLWVAGLLPVLAAISGVGAAVLRAREDSRSIFSTSLCCGIALLLTSVPAMWFLGFRGVPLALAVCGSLEVALMWGFVRRGGNGTTPSGA